MGAPILEDAPVAPLAEGVARALQGWAPRIQTSFDVADWNDATGPSLFSVLVSYTTAEGVVTVGDATVDTDCYTATWENAAGACVYWTVICEAAAGAQGCPLRQEFDPLGSEVCQGPAAPSPPPPPAWRQLPAGATCDSLDPLCDAQCADVGATEAVFSCYVTNGGGQYHCTCDGESYGLLEGDGPSPPSPPPARSGAVAGKAGAWAWFVAALGFAVLVR